MDVVLETLSADGWTSAEFTDVESIHIAGAPGSDGIEFTLIGVRDDAHNQIERGVLDVATRHERLLANPVPRTDDGDSIAVASRKDTDNW